MIMFAGELNVHVRSGNVRYRDAWSCHLC